MQIISQDCHIQVNPDHLSHSKVRIRGVINGMTGKTVVLYKYSNNYIHIIISKDCHIKVNLNHLSHSKVRSRGVINGKTDKVRQLSYPNIQICSYLNRGEADYAHHNTMGLVWLKFNVAPPVYG